jgi:hypothetical protein
MAGDQIVADWLGDVYSNNVQAVTAPTRFSATSLRYRSVHIYNTDIAASVYIGQFFASIVKHSLSAQKKLFYLSLSIYMS